MAWVGETPYSSDKSSACLPFPECTGQPSGFQEWWLAIATLLAIGIVAAGWHLTAQRRMPDERERRITQARTTVSTAIAREMPVQPPARTEMRILQAIVGAVVGGLVATAALFMLVHLVIFLIEGSGATRIRVPVKGVLAALIAPIAGVVIGAAVGWRFDVHDSANWLRQFLDSSSMLDRAWIAWGAVWTSVVLIAFGLFDPFGRYSFGRWRSGDLVALIAIWFGPIAAGWAFAHLVRWVSSGRRE